MAGLLKEWEQWLLKGCITIPHWVPFHRGSVPLIVQSLAEQGLISSKSLFKIPEIYGLLSEKITQKYLSRA